ncbi:MAG: sigma-70 family RNA polymerase sigma factor [Halieaceae bacterium]|jgi:RNA polymerase sigma factor (sigma-70 family)|nr:sigma-70 family RNA polymerase sigma factor [Halieaceae bacterium]
MNPSMINDTTTDTDFYLEASSHYPLLTADQERQIDLRKWAAARRCTRLLLNDARGRELINELVQACLASPPEVDQFDPRSLYFTLRKDIVDLLPGSKGEKQLKTFSRQLKSGRTSTDKLLASITEMAWPTTLVTGLTIIHLRRQGMPLPDLMADAMCIWQPAWSRRYLPVGSVSPDKVLHRALNQYVKARDKLVMHNLRLVHKLAWDHPARSIPQRDLVQDGIIGLIRAAEKFDVSRGFRFTTYAYPWINQHLQRATENKGSLITYPAHVVQEINQLHRARMAHVEATGHDPGIDVLAEETGFDADKVNRLRRLSNITVSIDHPEAEDNDLRHAASIPDPDSERAVEDTERNSVAKLLWQHIDKLEEREQAVITGRWGLDGRPQRTFAQLADQLHVSREWVRQLEKSALKKLGEEARLNEAFEEMRA